MPGTVRDHLPEYLIEGVLLGAFMVSAGSFATLLEHPGSAVHGWIAGAGLRRVVMGLAMGLTGVLLIYSRAGKRSGAHMNPAVTLAFLSLGRVRPADAAGYVAAQVLGGALGLALLGLRIGSRLAHPSVNWVATVPGPRGPLVALAAELAIAFVMMSVVLATSASPRLGRYTGVLAGLLVALYIAVVAPLSGMSLNPARSLASALNGQVWTSFWVYVIAPVLGMQAAATLHRARSAAAPGCAKLHHHNAERCIFCGKPAERTPVPAPAADSRAPREETT